MYSYAVSEDRTIPNPLGKLESHFLDVLVSNGLLALCQGQGALSKSAVSLLHIT